MTNKQIMYHIQEKQNYPFLDYIVPNLRINNVQFQSLKIPNSQLQQQPHQFTSNKLSQPCSKHSQKKGQYFQTQYPWIKFCQNCALNLALCGKKIQKTLSSQQMFIKITLCDLITKLGDNVKKIQSSHSQYSFLSTQLQRSRQGFIGMIHSLDKFINSLTQVKSQLQEKVQTLLSNQIKSLFQKQSLLVSKKIQLINQKMKIQCGFMQMVDKEKNKQKLQPQQNVQATIQKCKQLIKQSEQLISGYDYRFQLVKNVQSLENLFTEKTNQINQTKLSYDAQRFDLTCSQNQKLNWSYMNKSLSNIFRNIVLPNDLKTQKTLADVSSIHHQIGNTNNTTCENTVRNSGLVSPAQINDQVLSQMNQNRRHSRATLQLRARCRSKSGKKTIQVNVREQRQKKINRLS